MDNKFTLYCRGFPDDFTDSDLKSVFAKYGKIVKSFKHNNGAYSMVQYDNLSSCTNAIRGEHCIPPLNLYVNFARNQPTDRKDTNESSSPQGTSKYPPRNHQNDNMTSPRQFMTKKQSFDRIEINDQNPSPPHNTSFNGIQKIAVAKPKKKTNTVYKEDIIYMDRFNNILPVLKDFKDELYVPLSCIEGLKRYVKKTPICNGADEIGLNLDEYTLLDNVNQSGTKQDDDVRSQHSNKPVGVSRHVQFGEDLNDIKIQVDISGASMSNTTEPVFESIIEASRTNASRYSIYNKQKQANQQKAKFGGHTNENRPFHNTNNHRFDASENRPHTGEYSNQNRRPDFQTNDENRPYENRRSDSKPHDGKRNQNQPFNRNKPSHQDSNHTNNNQDQNRDFNKPNRNPHFHKSNDDGHARRSGNHHRKLENKSFEHKPVENDGDDWDTSATSPATPAATPATPAAPLSTLIHSLLNVSINTKQPSVNNETLNVNIPAKVPEQSSDNKKRYSASERLKSAQKLGIVDYKSIELPPRTFSTVKTISLVNETDAWVQLTDLSDYFDNTLIFDVISEATVAQPTTPEVGKLCLANYEDYWFRAVVLQTVPKLRVKYIDFGNEQDDPIGGTKTLSKKLADIPAHAIHIRLSDGSPCILEENQLYTIKPIKMDKDVYIVHVKNGMYNKEETDMADNFGLPPKPIETAPVNVLTELQASFMSLIHKGSYGIFEKTATISKNRFVAYIIPVDLSDLYRDAIDVMPSSVMAKFASKAHDLVIAFTDGSWSRAYVLSVEQNSYRVAFIDYGVIKVVQEVKPLPEKMAKLPQFAVMCQVDDNHTKIKGDLTFTTTSVSSDSFTIAVTINNTSFPNIVVTPWNPTKDDTNIPCTEPTPVSSPPNIQAPVSKPPTATPIAPKPTKLTELPLNNGDAARLVYTSGSDLYIRTKQAHSILKVIDEHMKQYVNSGKPVTSNVVVGQYVAAEYEGGWYRAVINAIKSNMATVLFIDYGNDEDKLISTFKVLNDEIRNQPCTLIKVKLRNFISTNFTVESLAYLESLVETNTLFKAQFTSLENGIDMIGIKEGINLSDHLSKIINKAPTPIRPMAESIPAQIEVPPLVKSKPEFIQFKVPAASDPRVLDIPVAKIPLGKNNIQFLCKGDWEARSLIVCLNDPDTIHNIHVELQRNASNYCNCIAPPEPYHPLVEEYILVKQNNKWIRAVCISEVNENDQFNCFFIDYGNSNNISKSDIRRMPLELSTIPAIANFANFNGIPEPPSQAIINRLEELLLVNKNYEVKVLNTTDVGFYDISFPSVLKVLKQERLI